jgi:cobalt/nickel transport system permease protein
MHMADALLSPAVGLGMWVLSTGSIAVSTAKIKHQELTEKQLPVMAVTGSFVFAAQMINFTIPATGSSGHITGGVLLSGLLGGYPALLTMTAVLMIQCLFFADGGLLALGCNIFNMGVIPCLIVYPLLFRPLLRKGLNTRRLTLASILSVVIGLQLGALSVVLETTVSGVTELSTTQFLMVMQPIHLAIGLVEGIVTAATLVFVFRTRPEILKNALERKALPVRTSRKKMITVLAILSVLLGSGLSLFSSVYPDGLEWSIEKVSSGNSEWERDDSLHRVAAGIQNQTAVLPDYDFPDGKGSGTSLSGLVGGVLTFVLAGGAGLMILLIKKRKENSK